MTASGDISGEKLAIDYLGRLTSAALRYLPKGDRIKFVGATRALIERECGPLAEADASRVAALLAELGEPQELVKLERARLDAAWARRRAASGTGGPAHPWEQRPLTARWRPAAGGRPRRSGVIRRRSRRGQPGEPAAAEPALPAGPLPPARPAPPGRPGEPGTLTGPGQRGEPGRGGAPAQGPQQGESDGPRAGGAGPTGPLVPLPPRQPGPPGQPPAAGQRPAAGLPVPSGPSGSTLPMAPLSPAGLAALARGQRREAAAVLLLGVGGLLLPLPFWPLGAAVAGLSRFWEARYKWLALYGPLLIFLVGTIPLAAVLGGRGSAIVVYWHMLGVDARYLVRLGCLATALYLGWLVRRGPRLRLPPWRR
jgi:hypothetical protein